MEHLGGSETILRNIDVNEELQEIARYNNLAGGENGNFGDSEDGDVGGDAFQRDKTGGFAFDEASNSENYQAGQEAVAFGQDDSHEAGTRVTMGTRVTRGIGSGIVKMAVIPQVEPGTRV
jgi:hypothetical protein